MLKIFVQPPDAPNGTPEQYVFSFTAGANARAEADAIKNELSTAIQSAKLTPSAPGGAKESTGEGVSPAMKVATAVSVTGPGRAAWDDDNRLKADVELQQSLLRSDPNLQRMFMESLHSKPETLTSGQFMSHFWSTRIHLLRAHAIERAQTRGSYNVLSTLKPRVEDNVTKMNISKEQIQLIFSQHPLVKRVYDENVPKLTEQQFWSRFFQSRLFKKLRGERVSDADATDAILDKYLKADEQTEREQNTHVPHFIDLAGNEVDHSQRQGNRPDVDMRPTSVPIIKTLNILSERIMSNVGPADPDASSTTAAGVDEETYNQLQLQDLRGDEEQSRLKLNIRDQSRFFAQAKDTKDEETQLFAKQDPAKVINDIRTDLIQTFPDNGSAQLGTLIEPEEENDTDDDEENNTKPKKPKTYHHHHQVGSKPTLQTASTQILTSIRNRREQAEQTTTTSTANTYNLPPPLLDRLTLTHATTTEFLHQFWQTFFSGNPDRAAELASLVESLKRARDRINAVSRDAEAERQTEVERRKAQVLEVFQTTGRKIRVDTAGVGGGEGVVQRLIGPTSYAVEVALGRYRSALEEVRGAETGVGVGVGG